VEHNTEIREQMRVKDSYTASVKRGSQDWAYFYTVLAFALGIEGAIIGMLAPLAFYWKLLSYIFVGSVTGVLVLCNGRVHDKLLAFKASYENKWR
jgi:hypothetical protein